MHQPNAPRSPKYASFLAFASLLIAGCSLSIDISAVQCEQNSDCVALKGGENTECVEFVCSEKVEEIDPVFGCRKDVWPVIDTSSTLQMTLTIFTVGRDILPGKTISQCDSLFDRECKTPIQTKVSDENGIVVFDVPVGFRGHYFAAEQGNTSANLFHSFPPPDPESVKTLARPFILGNYSEVTTAAAIAGVSVIPGTGALFFGVADCSENLLDKVTVTASPSLTETTTIYLSNAGLPDLNLEATGTAGSGAIANLPPGNVTIVAEHEEFGIMFEQTFVILPDTLSGGIILPAR